MEYTQPPIKIIEHQDGLSSISVDVVESGDGFCSRWWVTRRDWIGVQIIAYFELATYGNSLADAERRVGFMAPEVMAFMLSATGGLGTVLYKAAGGGSSQDYLRAHALAHVTAHAPHMHLESKTTRTAVLYDLLSSFHVTAPAILLADFEGLSSVRTIHDRLAEARKQGILPSPGQGRTYDQ